MHSTTDHGGFAARQRAAIPRGLLARGDEAYLPIESLRTHSDELFASRDKARTFLSSGTTQATRSRSHFSARGLDLYRDASVATFFFVLKRLFPGRAPESIRGLSLVPEPSVWPDSSLAQMVSWIAALAPVQYATEAALEKALDEVQGEEPLWIFGTAFHLINLIDSGFRTKLPPGSVVFETGGTKGRAREVTRTELFAEIESAFGIRSERIVSEYGMCELASQAYDWVDGAFDGAERRFRFPVWVRPHVYSGPAQAQNAGVGLLAVDDPLRIDYPWPLRTEDLIDLADDGSFKLLGRAPSTPLKGCSLLAEPALSPMDVRTSPAASTQARETLTLDDRAVARATALAERWPAFLSSMELEEALTQELGSRAAAHATIEDLRCTAPTGADQWLQATRVAVGSTEATTSPRVCSKRWLFILPDSHSLAGWQALVLGSIAGLQMKVRMPRRFATGENPLTLLLRLLADAPIVTLAPSFRLNARTVLSDLDALLAFGADETLASLEAFAAARGWAFVGFGSRMGMTVLSADAAEADVKAAARDALGLGQLGCMSTRLFVATGNPSTEALAELATALAEAGRAYWHSAIEASLFAALELEQARYAKLGFSRLMPATKATPLVVFRGALELDDLGETWSELVAARAFTLPLVGVQEKSPAAVVKGLSDNQSHFMSIGTVTVATRFLPAEATDELTRSRYGIMSFRGLGEANRPPWNGRHESRALFVSST